MTVFVPHYAMSGGTLLCLAADEVAMDNAVLGPVDPRIGDYPAASILKVPHLKPPEIDDTTFILVDIAAKAQNQMREFVAGFSGTGWRRSRRTAWRDCSLKERGPTTTR